MPEFRGFNKISYVILLLLSAFCLIVSCGSAEKAGEARESVSRPQLLLWYTDEGMTDFLEAAAFAYTEVDDSVRIVPVPVSGTEFINQLYDASLQGEAPDLYLASNDLLAKAYLAGLAEPLPMPENLQTDALAEPQRRNLLVNKDRFPSAAVDAVTCSGAQVGYPLYFQTSAFLYNKTLLEEIGESTPPATIRAIEDFAGEHDAPEGMESFFSWDVTDIFYNYFFVGGVMDVGGPAGDDPKRMDIANPSAQKALGIFQELNQFFSIDSSLVSSESVLREFREGKLLFTVATTDAVKQLAEAKAAGEFSFDYAFVPLPDIDEEIGSRSLSVTEAVCVNGFGLRKEKAHQFAGFLVSVFADELYKRTGKVPAFREAAPAESGMEAFYREYEDSVPIPKMIEAGALWVKLESAFTRIWEGEAPEEELAALAKDLGQETQPQQE